MVIGRTMKCTLQWLVLCHFVWFRHIIIRKNVTIWAFVNCYNLIWWPLWITGIYKPDTSQKHTIHILTATVVPYLNLYDIFSRYTQLFYMVSLLLCCTLSFWIVSNIFRTNCILQTRHDIIDQMMQKWSR